MIETLALTSRSLTHTRQIAAALASVVRPGDAVALIGPLGCGKTTLTSALVACLPGGEGVRVSSPTFTTVNTYPTTPPVYHMDLYRLAPGIDVDVLGYEEYLEGDGLCLVEWLDRAPSLAPPDYLELRYQLRSGNRRRLNFLAHGPRARTLLQAVHELA